MLSRADQAIAEARAAGQWHIFSSAVGLNLNVTEVWRDYTGRGVTVAIFDDGVEATHSDLAGNYDASLELAQRHA